MVEVWVFSEIKVCIWGLVLEINIWYYFVEGKGSLFSRFFEKEDF